MPSIKTFALVLLLAMPALVACGDSGTGADPAEIAAQKLVGDYAARDEFGAITFTVTQSGETTDLIAEGASIRINLAADGTTTGRVFVPGAGEDGGDFDEDLAGRWTLRNDTIRFSHDADTFVRDMPFRVSGNRLEGDRAFGEGTRLRVVLVRQ